MAVQIRLMGSPDEVAEVMDALVAGEPVTVMTDGGLAPNRGDGGQVRAFGMAQLPGASVSAAAPASGVRRAQSERLDRQRRGITR